MTTRARTAPKNDVDPTTNEPPATNTEDTDDTESTETGVDPWDAMLNQALIERRPAKREVDVPKRIQELVDRSFLNNEAVNVPVKDDLQFDELKNVLTCASDQSEHHISVYCKKLTDGKGNLTHLRFTVGKRRGNNPKDNGTATSSETSEKVSETADSK